MCANTQSAAIGSAKASFAIRHTGGARTAIQEARDALKLSWRYIEAFEAEAAKLYAAPMDTEQVRRFADILLEVEAAGTEATAAHRRQRANGIVTLWTSSPTIAPIAGTRWAAYNAVTEYLDHVVPVRGARTAGDASAARALRNITSAASSQIPEGPGVPDAANPATAASFSPGPGQLPTTGGWPSPFFLPAQIRSGSSPVSRSASITGKDCGPRPRPGTQT